MDINEQRRTEIRRQYRVWRAAVDLTQLQVEAKAREIYPEFPVGKFQRLENGLEYPTPTVAKAVAEVLGVSVDDLPKPDDDADDDAAPVRQPAGARA